MYYIEYIDHDSVRYRLMKCFVKWDMIHMKVPILDKDVEKLLTFNSYDLLIPDGFYFEKNRANYPRFFIS